MEENLNSNVQNMDELNQFHGDHQRVGSGDIDYMRDSRYFNRDHDYDKNKNRSQPQSDEFVLKKARATSAKKRI